MHVRFIFPVLLLFGVLAGCSENGTENQSGARSTLVAIATSTAVPTPVQAPTHAPAEVPTPTPALPVAITPALVPTLTTETTGTLQPVETASLTRTPQPLPGTWRDLIVAPEDRCSPYDSDDYPYNQSVENRIVEAMNGLIYGPLLGNPFREYTSDRHRAHCRTV